MVFDRTEHEPEEWDPEEEYADPDSDSLTIPRVPTEDAGSNLRSDLRSEFESPAEPGVSTAETDVSSDLLQAFWSIVLVVNAAVLAVSLGVLFLIFEGAITRSATLIGGGAILFAFAVHRYRAYRESERRDAADARTATDTETAESDTATGSTQPNAGETNSDLQSEHRSPDDPDRT
ncbi:DUF7322 domain-containing protein [Natronococcus wangiae]|uniref:DUF7322 domain-containing protein n=1 Tax=Natronococcus wangiae TaxID=3068275 RepID=UPI00273D2E86|nr:hypothetical protein [Natronococcus sp. AD5]